MSVIRWDNIQLPTSRATATGYNDARTSISGGFDKLAAVLRDREAANQGVVDRTNEAAAQDYLNLVQGFKTPEELNAARMSGVLDRRRAALDPSKQAAVRGAADARTTSLYQQGQAADAYGLRKILQPGEVAKAESTIANLPKILQTQALGVEDNLSTATFKHDQLPAQQDVARQELGIEQDKLPLERQTVKRLGEDQLVDQLTSAAAQDHAETQLTRRLMLTPLAKKLGLPLDASGAPDWNNMVPKDRARLQTGTHGMTDIPRNISELWGGDTQARNSHLAALKSDPRISASAITRNEDKISGAFNSGKKTAAIGNDAANINRRLAQASVYTAEQDARNRFAPGSADALTAYETLAKEIPELSADKEDVPALQGMLQRFATKGLEVRKGKFITPSAQDVRAALRAYEPSWGFNAFDNTQAEDIEEILKKQLEGDDVDALLQQAEQSRIVHRNEAVQKILSGK